MIMMSLLMVMWSVIDLVLFVGLIMIHKVPMEKYRSEIWQRSIERGGRINDKVADYVLYGYMIALGGTVVYAIIGYIPDIGIQRTLEWYKLIFISALYPIVKERKKEGNSKIQFACNNIFSSIAILLSIAGYIIDTEKIESITKYRHMLNILITIFVTTLLADVFIMHKEKNHRYSVKPPQKGIRKDLYYRIPRFNIEVSDIELIKYCEKYFDEYICGYRKVKAFRTIEYVTLGREAKELWYKKGVSVVKKTVGISIFYIAVSIGINITYKPFVIIVLIIVFGILVGRIKSINPEWLYRMVIRSIYDEWGYYITGEKGNKYVRIEQSFVRTKDSEYIQSLFDIVALCRVVAYSDMINDRRKICIISDNLSDLFINYTNYEEEKNWIMIMPLWVAALFEFKITGKVGEKVKRILLKSSNKETKGAISIFLQSFWVDMERKELSDGIVEFIRLFEKELYL